MIKGKFVLLGILLLCQVFFVEAALVSKKTAAKVAANHYYQQAASAKGLNASDVTINNSYTHKINNEAVYYIFTFENKGFVIVAADDIVEPVLGYSIDNNYDPSDVSPEFEFWMSTYSDKIVYHRNNQSKASAEITQKWNYLSNTSIENIQSAKSKSSVDPLLSCTWNQSSYYNALCPEDPDGPDGHVYSGCVATAMAMVMYYYRYPYQGQGSHGYNSNYGYLHVDFSNATYDWNAMLNSTNTYNEEMAEIQYHCGVAVNMNYSPNGSGAYSSNAADALKYYFKYSSSTQLVHKDDYTNTQWADLLKQNLDAKRPMYYHGYGQSGGHAFVCDGYQNNNYFHFNWGWSGSGNGFFYLDNLNPGGSSFTYGQGAIINIYPGDANYPYYCNAPGNYSSLKGTIEDGSGPSDYANNSSCQWLIEPNDPNADSISEIILRFEKFDTENANDIVNIYDGDNTSAPLLGSFSGNNLPPSVSSTGDKMLVTFTTNGSNTSDGWFANYEAVVPDYCSGEILTAPSGTFSDGSNAKNYNNESMCTWAIQVPDAATITIGFNEFDTEAIYDFIQIYDASKTPSVLVATYSGNNLPAEKTINSNSMFIMFFTNNSVTGEGWEAYYYSTTAGLNDYNALDNSIQLYPNPASDMINIELKNPERQEIKIELLSSTGKIVHKINEIMSSGNVKKSIDLTNIPDGIYFLRILSDQETINRKIIKN
jgi:hypothetical protein